MWTEIVCPKEVWSSGLLCEEGEKAKTSWHECAVVTNRGILAALDFLYTNERCQWCIRFACCLSAKHCISLEYLCTSNIFWQWFISILTLRTKLSLFMCFKSCLKMLRNQVIRKAWSAETMDVMQGHFNIYLVAMILHCHAEKPHICWTCLCFSYAHLAVSGEWKNHTVVQYLVDLPVIH